MLSRVSPEADTFPSTYLLTKISKFSNSKYPTTHPHKIKKITYSWTRRTGKKILKNIRKNYGDKANSCALIYTGAK